MVDIIDIMDIMPEAPPSLLSSHAPKDTISMDPKRSPSYMGCAHEVCMLMSWIRVTGVKAPDGMTPPSYTRNIPWASPDVSTVISSPAARDCL